MRPPFQPVTPINWPPFEAAELPPELRGDLKGILTPLHLATLELSRTISRYEMLAAIGRDWAFVNKINGTTAAPGMTTIKGCVYTAVVISLHALFDEAPTAVNLRAILNRVVRPEYLDRFRAFHKLANPTFDADQQRARLLRLQRRVNKGETGKALARLADLRNQIVAHLDTQPKFGDGWPANRDMVIVLAAATNMVVSLLRFAIVGRDVSPVLVRQNAQRQARALAEAIRPSVIGRLTEPGLCGSFFIPGLQPSARSGTK